jgi:hypothetical protein
MFVSRGIPVLISIIFGVRFGLISTRRNRTNNSEDFPAPVL